MPRLVGLRGLMSAWLVLVVGVGLVGCGGSSETARVKADMEALKSGPPPDAKGATKIAGKKAAPDTSLGAQERRALKKKQKGG